MLEEAQDRRHDADILGSSLATRSDSQAFLRVLAFEVLLRPRFLLLVLPVQEGTSYTELWDKLPATTQDMILAVARTRMPGNADLVRSRQAIFLVPVRF
jgi:hypothetical protein